MTRPQEISSREWLSMIRVVRGQLDRLGLKSDTFTVNRVLMNLWKAYQDGIADDPALTQAVLEGSIEIDVK